MPITPPESDCPMLLVLERVANKWAVLAVGALRQQPLRFNQLRRAIPGVSQKMLSQTLKGLERDGLVSRTVTPTAPIAVEYAVTPLGYALALAVQQLQLWSETHITEVLEARAAYDRRTPPLRLLTPARAAWFRDQVTA